MSSYGSGIGATFNNVGGVVKDTAEGLWGAWDDFREGSPVWAQGIAAISAVGLGGIILNSTMKEGGALSKLGKGQQWGIGILGTVIAGFLGIAVGTDPKVAAQNQLEKLNHTENVYETELKAHQRAIQKFIDEKGLDGSAQDYKYNQLTGKLVSTKYDDVNVDPSSRLGSLIVSTRKSLVEARKAFASQHEEMEKTAVNGILEEKYGDQIPSTYKYANGKYHFEEVGGGQFILHGPNGMEEAITADDEVTERVYGQLAENHEMLDITKVWTGSQFGAAMGKTNAYSAQLENIQLEYTNATDAFGKELKQLGINAPDGSDPDGKDYRIDPNTKTIVRFDDPDTPVQQYNPSADQVDDLYNSVESKYEQMLQTYREATDHLVNQQFTTGWNLKYPSLSGLESDKLIVTSGSNGGYQFTDGNDTRTLPADALTQEQKSLLDQLETTGEQLESWRLQAQNAPGLDVQPEMAP